MAGCPAALRETIRIWQNTPGDKDVSSPFSAMQLQPELKALLLAGYRLRQEPDGFAAANWLAKLRRALKQVRGSDTSDYDGVSKAIDWMLTHGLAQLDRDADGYAACDNITPDQCLFEVRSFLMKDYAAQVAKEIDTMPENVQWLANLFADIAALSFTRDRNASFDLAAALDAEPDPHYLEPIIPGWLRRGEVMTIVAAPKIGKSWMAESLALAAAVGGRWLGCTIVPSCVLLCDAELHRPTLLTRLKVIMEALEIQKEALRDKMRVESLRGSQATITTVARAATTKRFDLIIIDPIYKVLAAGQSEIDDAAIRQLFRELEDLAAKFNAAVVVVHHMSKGDNTKKAVTDRGSGSGVQSRAADVHMTICRDERNHIFVEGVVRTFRQPPKIYLQPISDSVPVLVPADQSPAEAHFAEGQAFQAALQFAMRFARPEPESRDVIFDRAKAAGEITGMELNERKIRALFDRAVGQGDLQLVPCEEDGRVKRYRRAETREENLGNTSNAALAAACPPTSAPA